MRVLVVRLGAFGDIVHTLPLAADLHAAGHRVHWLCEDRWAAVLDGSPAVTALHQLPRGRWKREGSGRLARLADMRHLRRELRAQAFDAVIDAQGLAKSAWWSLASGARRRIGHARPRARELSWLASAERTPCTATHVIDQQRALGGPLLDAPATEAWRFPLPAWNDQRSWAAGWMAEHQLDRPWALNVGAGWPTKVWPEERQRECLAALVARGQRPLVVWGSPAEREVAEGLVATVAGCVLAPPTDLPQLGALLARCRLLVSGDTGPLHLALAVGCPAVGLFGPVPAERNGPRGPGYRTLQAPGAAWERKDVAKVDMGAISAAQVLAAGDEAVAD